MGKQTDKKNNVLCCDIFYRKSVVWKRAPDHLCILQNKLSRVEVEPSRYGGTATKLVTIINCG